jgi:hypothetical protein
LTQPTTTTTTTTTTTGFRDTVAGDERLSRPGAGHGGNGNGQARHRLRGSRVPLVVVMIAGVLAAGLLRQTAVAYQDRLSARPMYRGQVQGASASALGSMNSFALALLLGGLRGPLAMILWSTSEAQKSDRNLEDFDTKVEWIRLLQPEFDTVHMFQIWNKAYNVSVQMADLRNRFAAILDALDYAADVDQQRPGNVNIMNAITQVYSNKLGTPHTEKVFYRRWVREQSFAPADYKPGQLQDRAARKAQGGWQRRRMDPKVDAKGYLLPEMITPKPGMERPADLPADSEWNNGAELQYLKQYEPFPYGVSTFALAYNYAKRAQVLMNVGKQMPLQLSDMVIDSRPGTELGQWTQDEWERGRQFEIQAAGLRAPPERIDLEMPTAGMPPDHKLGNPAEVAAAVYSYDTAVRVSREAVREFTHHISNPKFMDRALTYNSTIDDMNAIGLVCAADRDYLKAMVAKTPEEREPLLRAAADNYQKAAGAFQLVLLRYYVDEDVVAATYPQGINRATIMNVPRAEQDQTLAKVRKMYREQDRERRSDDYLEYVTYIDRATTRLGLLLRR